MANDISQMIADVFLQVADGLQTGSFEPKPRIALTGMDGEHGEEDAFRAACKAAADGVEVWYLGTLEAENVHTVRVTDDEDGHARMDELLAAGDVDGAVTMHYSFPIGVSTVGRVVTPAFGREMLVANTTGTASTDRVEGMLLNAVDGIAVARALGHDCPSIGILNVDGSRQTEMSLKRLQEGGLKFRFASSARADGGAVMRGNDVLMGSADIMVCDSLTGNVINKMLSSFVTGGGYEASGYGYGPGIGRGYNKLVMIVSRASGSPVIANAIGFAARLVRAHIFEIVAETYAQADEAGLSDILRERRESSSTPAKAEEVQAPEKELVAASILGIDVMDLDDAVKALWKTGIYAESGMGCTGPVVRVNDANYDKAYSLLKQSSYVS